ncbi:hemolysin family protein [Mycobacterium tuberculosis]|uniref:hemolysin family protein n=6 Tax=Mycobacterium tuberculosis TaxID=1773 RepID=UPI0005C69289|nr:hemolysin family protein [Mycobacterium tuberculosis]
MTGYYQLLGSIVLIGLGGLFAAIDAAISTVSPARVDELVRDQRPGAGSLRKVMADRPRYVNLVVLLRTSCEITATALLVVFIRYHFSMVWGLYLAAGIMVLASFVVVGVGPRTLGRQNAYSISLATALPLRLISWLLMPISRLLVLLGNALTPGCGFRNGPFASEIELREVVDLAQQRGVVAADERRMIESVFELGDTPAREVMVPRTEMIWIESDKTAGQAMTLAVRSGHSRIPVIDKVFQVHHADDVVDVLADHRDSGMTLAVRSGHSRIPVIGENVDDIVGVVYLKDLVEQTFCSTNGGRETTVARVMRPAVFVPDSKPLDALLREMQRDRNHMALLVDEYGAIAGLVSIEDVLEEIVGEIADEYDQAETAPVEDLGDKRFRVSARLPIEDVGELYGVEFDDDLDVDTVGGLLALELGRVPLPGAEVISHGLRLHAEGGTDHRGRVRIGTVLLSPAEPDGADDEEADHPG